MKRTIGLFAAAAAFAALPAYPGVKITGQQVDLSSNATTNITMRVDDNNFRVDSKGPKADSSMIFTVKGDDYQLITIDNQKNEYRVIDKATMEEMQQKMSGAMAQMEAQMKNLPPEQRAMMEKMMKGRMPQMGASGNTPQTTYKMVGPGSVNGYSCKKYEGTRAGEKVSEICAADPGSLHVTASDFAVVKKMQAVFQDMLKKMSQMPMLRNVTHPIVAESQIDGFPIQRIQYENGKAESKFEITNAGQQSFSSADFSTGNAKKVEMNFGSRGR